MTRFAPVAGIGQSMMLAQAGALGDTALVLVHDLLKAPFHYGGFWRHQVRTGQVDLLILDNSVVELGYPYPMGAMAAAADTVGAHVIVIPDFMEDGPNTVAHAKECLALLGTNFRRQTMGVVQGTDWDSALECAKKLARLNSLDMLAVPRHLGQKLGSRVDLVKEVVKIADRPIHLLGFSDDIQDDMAAARVPGVISIDSATPIWVGQQGWFLKTWMAAIEMNQNMTGLERRPDNYLDVAFPLGTGENENHYIGPNLEMVREWLKLPGAKAAPTPEAHAALGGQKQVRSSSSAKPQVQTKSARANRSSDKAESS